MAVMRIVIPVKPFGEAKRRLATAMDAATRANLARDLFGHVFAEAAQFAGPGSVVVVSRSPEILQFAEMHGAAALPEGPEPELNAALECAAARARAEGVARLLVIASDLPLLGRDDLAMLADDRCAVAPDTHGTGTNALLWPLTPDAGFHFGENSFARHCAAARRCRWEPRIVISAGLAHDIDVPDDLIGRFRPKAKARNPAAESC